MCVFESVCGFCSSRRRGGSETADLSLTPCVVFVSGRWRAASRCWKSSRPTVWRDSWTHWGVYECVCFRSRGRATHKDFNISLFVAFLFRYTTRHLNDDSTSKQIRALLQWERGDRRREGGKKECTWRRRKEAPVADKPVCLQRTKRIISGLRETCRE